jgi:hypothetical protein
LKRHNDACITSKECKTVCNCSLAIEIRLCILNSSKTIQMTTEEVQEGPDAPVTLDATATETEKATPSVNENNDEPKKETHDERQTRLKAEARAFALSGGSCLRGPATYNQQQNINKKQKRKAPVKRRAKKATNASYSSESSNSSISDFSDDDEDDNDAFFGSNKKRKATQEESNGGFLVPTMYQMPTAYMTVRVQVPYEELLPGRKMVVDLPGRLLPLEVVVPMNIAPGTIIPVQVPLGEGVMDPYSSQQYPLSQQQQKQQKKQKKIQVPLTCRDQNWMNVFKRLVAYQKEHHTTRVPRTYNIDSRLGRWVFQQREEKKNMTEDKRLLLNSIDFDWDVPTRAPTMPWAVMYEQLAEYYRKNKTTMLTKKNGSDNRLFSWCSGQRDRYRKKNMPDDQVKLLNDLHFDFEHSLNNTWMEKYKLMIKYKEENGTTRAPKSHPELGQWVANQRQRKPSLKKERIELLDKIDFDWTKGHTPDTVWNGFVKGKDEASV